MWETSRKTFPNFSPAQYFSLQFQGRLLFQQLHFEIIFYVEFYFLMK